LPSSAIDLVRLQKLVTKHHELLEAWWKHGDSPVAGDEVHEDTGTSVCEEIHDAGDSTEIEDTEQELRQLDARMAEFAEELKNKELRLHELKSQARQSSSAQHPGATSDDSPLYKRKRALEERIAILRKAITLLADAVDEFGRAHLAGLNEEASKLFSKITGGRYPALKLDENMTPSVHVDGRRWMPVENFSRGTTDAVYLALRVALAKVRDDGRSLPLMLDDPFVHLDQKRLATTLNLVDLASADGQLILFSHNLDLGKRAARERWHVVPLNVDSVDTIIEEGGEHAGQLHLL